METADFSEPWLPKPAIYSPQALLGFSALVNPLMGGLLAYQSLRWAGRSSVAGAALCASFNFWVFTLLVSSNLKWGGLFGIGLGYVWGRWLNRYISRKLPDATNYPPAGTTLPFLISLFLGTVLVIFKLALRHY